MSRVLVIWPDGRTQALEAPAGDELEVMRAAMVGEGWTSLDRFPEAFHALAGYEVWHLDDWLDEPANLPASRMVGLDTVHYQALRGPIGLLALPEGQDTHAEREHQRRYFGVLDAVAAGFSTADEAGIGVLIQGGDEDAA